MNTIPYSLELWEEHFIEATSSVPAHWDESRVVFLGGDSMDYPGKAYDIRFTQDVYGELKLEFSIDGIFTNTIGGAVEKNYLIDYLFSEVKIKLKYDNKWYDFILKDITETHNQTFTLNCSCISLASSELSKIGYEIKFTLDDNTGNAVQDAHSFMDAILKDTEWEYAEAGTQEVVKDLRSDLIETVEEIAFLYEINQDIDAYDFSFNNGILQKEPHSKRKIIDGYLLIPYSALETEGDCFVFYTNTVDFLAQDGYFITKDRLILASLPKIKEVTTTEYTIEVPKKNIYTEYIQYNDYNNLNNSINQYCKKIKYNGNDGYCREITHIPDYGYKKTNDPMPCYRYIVENTILENRTLHWAFSLTEDPNISEENKQYTYYRFSTKQILHANDTLDFYIQDGKGIISVNGNWDTIWEANVIFDSQVDNKITGTKRYYYTQEIGVNGIVNYREWANLTSFESDTIYYEAAFDTKKTLDNLSDEVVFTVNQFFITTRDNSNKISAIEVLGYGKTDETFFYQEDSAGTYVYNPITGLYSEGTGSPKYKRINYTPIETYNMYRTIQAEKSNCFNLTQTVAETFEVWCRYLLEHDENGHISLDENGRRKKWVTLTSSYGKKNEVGFTYGLNAKSITRNVQTNELVTKLYVDYCENNVADDGFVSIQLADDNISKENFLFNFDYFIQKGILEAKQVALDLNNIESSESNFDILTAVSYLGGNKKAPGYLRHLGLLNKSYDTIQSMYLGTGEGSLTNQLINSKTQLEAYRVAIHTSNGSISGNREEDKKRYQELIRLVKEQEKNINYWYGEIEKINARKKELHREFNQKYARFIYEGNWQDSSYINHNAYYADALKVSSDASKPSVSYTIDVENLRIAEGDGYELFAYEVGDETWIEDEEYFGHYNDGRPYHEAVIVTEIVHQLDNQLNSQITIANHSNKFEDLFQRLSATAQSYSINQQTFNRASNLTSTGALKYLSLQSSFDQNKQLTLISNNLVTTDDKGITVRNAANPNEIVRMISGGIVLSNDGGETYATGITAQGINTSLLSAGQINTENIRVVSTGSTGVIEMNGSELRMFAVGDQGFERTTDEEADSSKIYYIYNGTQYISADTSRGFKKNANGTPIEYYEYNSSPYSELYFSPSVGIQLRHEGSTKFQLDRDGNLTATDLHLRGGDIELTDAGRTVSIGQILTQGSKINVSNEIAANATDENSIPMSAVYGSYGLELLYNYQKNFTLYTTAINDGPTIDMYGSGSEINLYGDESSGDPEVLKIQTGAITFQRRENGILHPMILNFDKVSQIHQIHASTTAPTGADGEVGDLWIQY